MIKAVIFDADGMLINGRKFSRALARDFVVDYEKEKEFFTTKFQECLVGKADLKESIAPYIDSFGWRGTIDELLEYWFKTEHSLDKALVKYVQKLRDAGIHASIATNQEKYRTRYMREHMGFDSAFDRIYSSAHLGVKKPAQAFFAKVTENLGLQKEEVLFWDDDQVHVDGALAYGIPAERYTDYPTFLETMKTKYAIDV